MSADAKEINLRLNVEEHRDVIFHDPKYAPSTSTQPADPVPYGSTRPVGNAPATNEGGLWWKLPLEFVVICVAVVIGSIIFFATRDAYNRYASSPPASQQQEVQVAPPAPAYVAPPQQRVEAPPAPSPVAPQTDTNVVPVGVAKFCAEKGAGEPYKSEGKWKCKTDPWAGHLKGPVNERLAKASSLTEFKAICLAEGGKIFTNQRGKPQCDLP